MEINGFEVEEYNIYGIPAKAKSHTCPKCSHTRKKTKDKCMSVYWDTGLGKCNHCGETVQLHTYKRKNKKKEYKIPPQTQPTFDYSEAFVKWWKEKRGISASTLERLKITEGIEWMPQIKDKTGVIKFNYHIGNNLINIKYRTRNKDFKLVSGAEKTMYNLNAIFGEKEAVIVEGEIDVAAYYEAGVYNVVSVPNGFNLKGNINMDYLDNCYEYFENKERIYLGVDNDAAGEKGKQELIRRFGAEKIWLIDYKDCKDANEYLLKYGLLDLQNTLEEAKQLPLENIVTIDDQWDDLIGFWENGAPKGMSVGMRDMDNAITFDWKQYTLMLSAPGSGKSEKIDDIIVRLIMKYNVKAAFCSIENEPFYLHYNKIFRKILGRTPAQGEVDSDEINSLKEFVQNNICHVEFEARYELKAVLKKFEELVKRKGVRLFVLDPFNKIKLKEKGVSINDINKYTAEYHLLLDEFVKRNNCHLFLVLHPTKLSTKEGSSKTYIMPTAYNAKGGGEHFDMSYNIIGMVRDYERNLIHFRTLKVKFQHLGSAGKDWFEAWNMNNGRFTEIEEGYEEESTHSPEIFWHNGNWMHSQPWNKVSGNDLPEKKELPKATLEEAFDVINDDDFSNDEEIPF